jgi:hypothetical protein
MTETEVLFQISEIVNRQRSFSQAVQQIALLLECEVGGRGVIIQQLGAPSAVHVLDSIDQLYRSFYTVALRDAGEALGEVTLCFASDDFQGNLPQRLSDFVGEQLGMLLARTRLAERRAQLQRELMQRAEGLLIARRNLAPAVAKRWITQQSVKTGLSKEDVADRVIAYYQATGLLERRIA